MNNLLTKAVTPDTPKPTPLDKLLDELSIKLNSCRESMILVEKAIKVASYLKNSPQDEFGEPLTAPEIKERMEKCKTILAKT